MTGSAGKRALNAAHGATVFGRRVEVLAHRLAAAIPAGTRTVLDVGAGDGSIDAAIGQLRPELTITGVDVLVRPETKIPVTPFDGSTLPFPDASFDVVMFVDVLHHTEHPDVLLAEAARVAGDVVVVKDHVVDGLLARPTLRFMDWVGNRGHDVVLPYNYLDDAAWRRVTATAGLREESRETHLGLYPKPFTWWFDRRLHLVSVNGHVGGDR